MPDPPPAPPEVSPRQSPPLTQNALKLAEAFTGVVARLSNTRSLEELGKVVNAAIDLLLGTGLTICILHDDEDDWENLSGDPAETGSLSGADLIGSRETVGVVASREGASVESFPFPAYVIVPVRPLGPVGFIGAYWKDHHEVSEAEEKVLQLLANTVSFALKDLELQNTMESLVEERTEALQSVNAELQTFAYTVSHDLKNPLAVVKMNSWTLKEVHGSEFSEKARLCVGRLEEATNRMSRQIDGMLAMYRLTKADLNPTEVDLAAMAWQILDDLAENDPSKEYELVVGDDLRAYGDDNLLRVVLDNLLGNAWKYSAKTAHPKIEFGLIEIDDEPVFFVRDNGAGFEMKKAAKLFNVFHRMHLESEFPGNGIGLASVQRIIHKHGGQIRAEGAVGEGATFFFELPEVPVLVDLEMPVMSGLELLDQVQQIRPGLPVIVMTAFTSTDRAIEATKQGAFDYLPKPIEIDVLLGTIKKAVKSGRLTAKPIAMGEIALGKDAIVGSSPPMQEVFKEVGRVAANPIPVLITGETGTGKELIARAIFQHSERAGQAFVAVNCAAIPENLIESELFGHERGAFTGALHKRIGRFEQADSGTLFLDEIGDLPPETQVKLLRVLQEKSFSRVGGKENIPVDVRLITATHRDLDAMIAEGLFREDLYFRINATQIKIPPLRSRLEDIDTLTDYLLSKFAGELEFSEVSIHKDARKRLLEHPWYGNIRELENVLRKALIDSQGRTISVDLIDHAIHLASRDSGKRGKLDSSEKQANARFVHSLVAGAIEAVSLGVTEGVGALAFLSEQIEEELFRQAIVTAHGNQSKMAALIGVSRITVREKLDKYDLLPKREKKEVESE